MIGALAWGNTTLIELIWTAIGIVSLYITWGNLRDAKRYVDAAKGLNGEKTRSARHRMRVIAFGHYRNEAKRVLISLLFIITGLMAMLIPPTRCPHRVHPATSPLSYVLTISFFMIEGLIVLASALDRRQRQLLLND